MLSNRCCVLDQLDIILHVLCIVPTSCYLAGVVHWVNLMLSCRSCVLDQLDFILQVLYILDQLDVILQVLYILD